MSFFQNRFQKNPNLDLEITALNHVISQYNSKISMEKQNGNKERIKVLQNEICLFTQKKAELNFQRRKTEPTLSIQKRIKVRDFYQNIHEFASKIKMEPGWFNVDTTLSSERKWQMEELFQDILNLLFQLMEKINNQKPYSEHEDYEEMERAILSCSLLIATERENLQLLQETVDPNLQISKTLKMLETFKKNFF